MDQDVEALGVALAQLLEDGPSDRLLHGVRLGLDARSLGVLLELGDFLLELLDLRVVRADPLLHVVELFAQRIHAGVQLRRETPTRRTSPISIACKCLLRIKRIKELLSHLELVAAGAFLVKPQLAHITLDGFVSDLHVLLAS